MPLQTQKLTRIVFFIAITLIIQALGLPQPVTGPLINMMLLLTTLILGPLSGMALGAITPVVAAFRGQLPPLLIPMVPFIIVSNALLVSIFALVASILCKQFGKENLLINPGCWIGLLAGSVVKFLWLYMSAVFLVPLFFGKELPEPVVVMMALPQFITALFGGILAFVIFQLLKKRIHIDSLTTH